MPLHAAMRPIDMAEDKKQVSVPEVRRTIAAALAAAFALP